MNRFLILFILFAFSTISCAGSPTHIGSMLAQGKIRIEPVDNENYDYKVSMINYGEIGFDADRKDDRLKAINHMFKDICEPYDIIGETSIITGRYLLKGDARTWIIKVKCLNK